MYFLSIKYDRHCWTTACLILSLFLKRGPEADWGEGAQYFVSTARLEPPSASESIFTYVASSPTNLLQQKEAQTREKRTACLPAVALPTSWFVFLRCFAYWRCLITWRACILDVHCLLGLLWLLELLCFLEKRSSWLCQLCNGKLCHWSTLWLGKKSNEIFFYTIRPSVSKEIGELDPIKPHLFLNRSPE